MKKQHILFLGLILLALVALTACQAGTKVTTAPQVTQNTSSADNTPGGGAGSTYPAPGEQQAPEQQQAVNPYPVPAAGSTISWEDAIKFIKNNAVTQVAQSKSLEVTITFQDGTTVKTTEPSLDAVVTQIKECGVRCKDIKVVTE